MHKDLRVLQHILPNKATGHQLKVISHRTTRVEYKLALNNYTN